MGKSVWNRKRMKAKLLMRESLAKTGNKGKKKLSKVLISVQHGVHHITKLNVPSDHLQRKSDLK